MERKKIVILGSTGSIGEQALQIVREQPDLFEVLALSCNNSWKKLARQIKEFQPAYSLLGNEEHRNALCNQLGGTKTELVTGIESLPQLAVLEEADVILNSLVGFAGFEPTVCALKAGKQVALANKESLVIGGELISELLRDNPDQLLPVDSEHSAMLQCMVGEPMESVEKLIITASGGPFRSWTRQQMEEITVADALDHPNWTMGAKITIDSATMMNKGLEIIEAHWLFDMPMSKIEAVVHPQSVIHSIVTFADGSSKAQLGPPTMKVPILYALTYPDRIQSEAPQIDWETAFGLDFEPVDYERFPCLRLALEAAEKGGVTPAVLNAANEIAVQRFLDEEITYIEIAEIIEVCMNQVTTEEPISVDLLKKIDQQTRELALTL